MFDVLIREAATRFGLGDKALPVTQMLLAYMTNKDTGGLIGVPITISGNSIPVGRVYQADIKAQKMVAASDWIKL